MKMKSFLLSQTCLLNFAIATIGTNAASIPDVFATSRNTQRECADNEGYTFRIKTGQDVPCTWLLKNANPTIINTRRSNWCDGNQEVGSNCSQSCGYCGCKNFESFSFTIATGEEQKCEWINKAGLSEEQRRKRFDKWCDGTEKTDVGPVANFCPASCGKCEDDCEDDTDYRFRIANNSMQPCSWILQSKDDSIDLKRKNRWCNESEGDNVLAQCKKTCGVCGSNPSPVAPTPLPPRPTPPAPTPPAPTPPIACFEDDSFKFKIVDNSMKPCSWILQSKDDSIDQKRLDRWCDASRSDNVRAGCPVTCNACPESVENELLDLVNKARAKEGLGQLCFNAKLTQAAYKHSVDMMENRFFSHTGSNGSELSQRVAKEGYRYDTVAENIASYQTIAGAHTGLMNSPGHYDNIMWPAFTHIGLGIVRRSNNANFYITQVFAYPREAGDEVCDNGSTPRPTPSRRDGSGNTPSPTVSMKPTKVPKTSSPTLSMKPTKTPKTSSPTVSMKPTKTPKTSSPTVSVKPTKTPKTSSPTVSVKPTKTPKTSSPTVSMKPTKTPKTSKPSSSPRPTKAPKKPKKCKKPKGTKEVEITISLTAGGDLSKDDINYLTCTEDEESRMLREVRLLNATEAGIVSAEISKLTKAESECESSCQFEAEGDVHYIEDNVQDLEGEIETWLDDVLSSYNHTFSIEEDDKNDLSLGASTTDTITINHSGAGSGAALGVAVAFAALVFVGLAFFIHRRMRNNSDEFSEVQTTSEGELESVRSNSARSWRNVFDASRSKKNISASESQPITFPVASNSYNTEFEVTK